MTKLAAVLLACSIASVSSAAESVDHPFLGVTHITRTETSPRPVTMHIVRIDLTIAGIGFRLTPPGGTRETVRQTTLAYLGAQQAQVAINGHFFLPFPSADLNAMLIGLGASDGNVFSAFEAPLQSYALVTDAPAINIDPSNFASVVHRDTAFADGTHIVEPVVLWNTVAGSAQIVTNGVKTIPFSIDAAHPDGQLTPPGPANYSNGNSWYNLINARTAIGISHDLRTLLLFTVDRAGGSLGLSVGEVADILINDYGVYNALNLDGGGSTTLAMEHPITHQRSIVNVSSDNPNGRAVASSLAVFAAADTIAPSTVADLLPAPAATRWNNSTITVTLAATDNPGGAVRDVRDAFTGAHAEPAAVVNGDTVTKSIAEEGSTTVSFFATDFAGNEESPRAQTVNIDKTGPVVTGLPNADCVLWPPNGSWHQVATISAVDALSGPGPDTFNVDVEISETVEGATDDVRVVASGVGTREIWLRAKRSGKLSGRRYAITASAGDLAGNVATSTAACLVPHDQRK